MSKFLLISDIHIHPWSAFSKINNLGVNDRLTKILYSVRVAFQIAKVQNCEAVLFSGDLFHTSTISADTYDLTVRILRECPIPIVMIPGNHDESSKVERFHALRALNARPKLYVLDKIEGNRIKLGRTSIGGIPYLREGLEGRVDKFKNVDILLLHTGFVGATMGSDFVADDSKGINPLDIPFKRNDIGLVVAGHFHSPQVYTGRGFEKYIVGGNTVKTPKGTIIIPGAPVQHTFGDRGSNRGCWVLDTKKNLSKFYQIDHPTFIKFENTKQFTDFIATERGIESLRNNFVSLKIEKKFYDSARDVLESVDARYTITIETTRKKKKKGRIDLSLESGYGDSLAQYIKSHPDKKVNLDKAFDVGMKILKD